LQLELETAPTVNLMRIVQRVRRMLDLDADPMFIAGHLSKDPHLAPVVQSFPGLRVPGGWDSFEIAVRAIIGQQVSIKGANTITARLVKRCGMPLDSPVANLPGITHLFPNPKALAYADLTGIGMPGKRIETVKQFAKAVAYDQICFDAVSDPEEIKRKLIKIPGIGQWTAQYVAMRALRQPDAFPGTDLALKREVQEMTRGSDKERGKKIKRPDIWRPWRAYAAVYLWKNYGNKIQSNGKETS